MKRFASVRPRKQAGQQSFFTVSFEDVPLMDFMCLVFTHIPGGVTVDDSGLGCCVPCLSSAIISLCLWVQLFFSFFFLKWVLTSCQPHMQNHLGTIFSSFFSQ